MNYDHPDSLETDLLVEHLKELKAGRAIDCPVYDYSLHNRSDEVIRIEPKPVILVEGILLLADERIRDLLDIKIYVEADADEMCIRDRYYTNDEMKVTGALSSLEFTEGRNPG